MVVGQGERSGPVRLWKALLVAAATALVITGSPALATPSAAAVAPPPSTVAGTKLPKCRVADVLTRHRRPERWQRTLVDHELRVSKSYAPKDLVPVTRAKVSGVGKVRKIIVKDLRAMGKAARADGAAFSVRSAYRSYATQKATFARWQRQLGYRAALRTSARAGHTEHQLGPTVDLRAAGSTTSSFAAFGYTKAGKWVAKHAWKYGFVMSYPEGKTDKTCYKYESWHFRYVGKETAKAVRKSGLTLREYLWREHHQPKKKKS